MATRSTRAIDSLLRGIDLLEVMAERHSVRLAELPEILGVSRATAFRVLKTLEDRGYVEHVRDERSYRLGPSAAILAARSQASAIIHLAEPALADLRETTGETVNLALFSGGRLFYVQIVEGRHAIRMSGSVGEEIPLHATALGKATLAVLEPEERKNFLGPEPYLACTEQTLTTYQKLERDLDKVRELGYSLDLEEMDFGANCVGTAIVSNKNRPVGALSVAGLAARFTAEACGEIGEQLVDWCQHIGRSLEQSIAPDKTTNV